VAPDARTVEYLMEYRGLPRARAEALCTGLASDAAAEYCEVLEIDAAAVRPMLALPGDPGNGIPIHAAGARIFGATITPVEGCDRYTTALEQQRQKLNAWILAPGHFDGHIDFAHALADPADPLRMLPTYDSGDHLHPNDAGYTAMSNTINLNLFN